MFIFQTVEFVEVSTVLIVLIVTLLKIDMPPLSPVLDKLVLCDTETMHCSVRKLQFYNC